MNITRILGMGQRMCEAGNYASSMIRMEAGRLEREWRSLTVAVDDRNTVLRMSVVFHKKAEIVCILKLLPFHFVVEGLPHIPY